ncbi:MAG: hypothetical protein JWP87_2365 [Labilithrix sp.]|jgi:hypothetical protein|nr:hypothetical protein [Labilithrix sp.]
MYDPYKPPQIEPAEYDRHAALAPGFRPTPAGLVASLFIGGAVTVEAIVALLYFANIDPETIEALNSAAQTISGVCRLVGCVAFLMWTHRTVANARAFGTHLMRNTPGRAVGFWFVPFMNLVHGYQVVSETWQASDPDSVRADGASLGSSTTPAFVLHWWLAYLASRVAITACRISWSVPAYIAATFFELAAVALMALVIRRLDRRQHARARAAVPAL